MIRGVHDLTIHYVRITMNRDGTLNILAGGENGGNDRKYDLEDFTQEDQKTILEFTRRELAAAAGRKLTEKEFLSKWTGTDRDTLSGERLLRFIDDCFSCYEQKGFKETFDSPYDDHGEHNGMAFTVIRRSMEGESDLEALPIWKIRFQNGDEAWCYPKEIIK